MCSEYSVLVDWLDRLWESSTRKEVSVYWINLVVLRSNLEWKWIHGQINAGNGVYCYSFLRKSVYPGISKPCNILKERILFNFLQSSISQINILNITEEYQWYFFLNITLGTIFEAYVSECCMGNNAICSSRKKINSY